MAIVRARRGQFVDVPILELPTCRLVGRRINLRSCWADSWSAGRVALVDKHSCCGDPAACFGLLAVDVERRRTSRVLLVPRQPDAALGEGLVLKAVIALAATRCSMRSGLRRPAC